MASGKISKQPEIATLKSVGIDQHTAAYLSEIRGSSGSVTKAETWEVFKQLYDGIVAHGREKAGKPVQYDDGTGDITRNEA